MVPNQPLLLDINIDLYLLRLATDLRMVLEPDPLHLALDLVQLEDIKLVQQQLELVLSKLALE